MTEGIPLEPGAVLTTAELGPCVGGVIRIWTEAGSTLWTPEDPAALRDLLGRGLLARTRVGPDRYREVGLLDAASGALALVPRFPSSTDADGVTLEGQVVSLHEAASATDSATEDFLALLTGAIVHAGESGEHVLVEKGGATSPSEPSHDLAGDASAAADDVATWGVEPWDVVLTFWRPTTSRST